MRMYNMKRKKILLSSLGAALLGGGFLLCAPISAQQQNNSILTEQELISKFPGLSVEELESVANTVGPVGSEYENDHVRKGPRGKRETGIRHNFQDRTITVNSSSHDVNINVGENYGGRWIDDNFVADLIQRVYTIKRSPNEGWTKKVSLTYYEHYTEATGTLQSLDAPMWLEYPGSFPENPTLKRTTAGPFMTTKATRGRFQSYISRGYFRILIITAIICTIFASLVGAEILASIFMQNLRLTFLLSMMRRSN